VKKHINQLANKVNAIGLPFIIVCHLFFFSTTWISERVQHMPALQLAGIRQFIEEFSMLAFFIQKKPKGKQ
jgi:hypothetical protein